MHTQAEERARLAVLDWYGLADAPPEPEFHRITALAARLCAAPIALLSLVGADRQVFLSRHGLDLAEAPPDAGFCRDVVRQGAMLVVQDARADPGRAGNPFVAGAPGLRFFAGAPLRMQGGHVLGALCVADRRPRPSLSAAERQVLEDLAATLVALFETRQRARQATSARIAASLERDLLRVAGDGTEAAPMQTALGRICEACGAQAGTFWRLFPDGRVGATEGHPEAPRPAERSRAEATPIGRALLQQRRRMIDLAVTEPDGLPELANWQSSGLGWLLVLPLLLGEQRCALTLLFREAPVGLDWLGEIGEMLRLMLTRHEAARQQRVVIEALDAVSDSLLILEPAPARAAAPRILYASAGAARLSGWKVEDIEGATPALFLGARPHRRPLAILRAAMREGRPVRVELPVTGRDGDRLWVETEVTTLLDAAGAPVCHVAVQRDLTRRDERDGQDREDERLRANRQVAGGVAEQFRDLLGDIMGELGDLLEQVTEDGPQRHRLDAALFAASRGTELTGQLLAYARRQELHPEVAELQEVVLGFLPVLHCGLGERHGLELDLRAEGARVEVDAQQLEAAVLQLVLNAQEAMPQGGTVRLAVARRTLARRMPALPDPIAPGRYVTIAVEDDGVGIQAADRQRVLEPFFSTKGAIGLGLCMAHGFVRQSGGFLDLRSRPDVGTRVELLFPEASAR